MVVHKSHMKDRSKALVEVHLLALHFHHRLAHRHDNVFQEVVVVVQKSHMKDHSMALVEVHLLALHYHHRLAHRHGSLFLEVLVVTPWYLDKDRSSQKVDCIQTDLSSHPSLFHQDSKSNHLVHPYKEVASLHHHKDQVPCNRLSSFQLVSSLLHLLTK